MGNDSSPKWATVEEGRSFNLDTVPYKVFQVLCWYWEQAHGQYHRGKWFDRYATYLHGVADTLYMNRDELETAMLAYFHGEIHYSVHNPRHLDMKASGYLPEES